MIQAVMLVLLGFLAASLLVLLAAPAFWSRAVRLTTDRIRRTLPVSEKEIRADKDLLRAEYAVKVHQLEKEIEQAKMNAHRQLIEINRRDAAIARFETDAATLVTDLEENRNARHVLEQTVNDRIPRVEARLREARQLLSAREAEIAELNLGAQRQAHALAEAKAINEQQLAEIERLQSSVGARQSRDRRRFTDLGVESEFALRTEVEALRSRSREQGSLIQRLQAQLVSARSGGVAGSAIPAQSLAALAGLDLSGLGEDAADSNEAEIQRLKRELEAAQIAVIEAAAEHGDGVSPDMATEVATLKLRLRDQAAEIARLTSERDQALGSSAVPAGDGTVAPAKLASRLDLMQNRAERDSQTIQRLRSELAAANERAARQAAYFMEEMRRFGVAPNGQDTTQRRRAAAVNGDRSGSGAGPAVANGPKALPAATGGGGLAGARRRSFESLTRALGSVTDEPAAERKNPAAAPLAEDAAVTVQVTGQATGAAGEAPGRVPASASGSRPAEYELAPEDRVLPQEAGVSAGHVSDPEQRRRRLLDRLRSYEDS